MFFVSVIYNLLFRNIYLNFVRSQSASREYSRYTLVSITFAFPSPREKYC